MVDFTRYNFCGFFRNSPMLLHFQFPSVLQLYKCNIFMTYATNPYIKLTESTVRQTQLLKYPPNQQYIKAKTTKNKSKDEWSSLCELHATRTQCKKVTKIRAAYCSCRLSIWSIQIVLYIFYNRERLSCKLRGCSFCTLYKYVCR